MSASVPNRRDSQSPAAVVEVLFKGRRSAPFRNPRRVTLGPGDFVVVKLDRGEDLGQVLHLVMEGATKPPKGGMGEILRLATREDLAILESNREKEQEAYLVCLEKIEDRELEMKLVDVEFQFDLGRITFYFVADRRVDFRDLVRDLAAVYRTRIEMRQIGVRDEAKKLGGHGACGREFCCSSFLRDFQPVTLRMAREQQLSLAPAKISGACGRLMCCLAYEREAYREANRRLPKVGTKVWAQETHGTVIKADILRETITIATEMGTEITVPISEVRPERSPRLFPRKPRPRGKGVGDEQR